MLNNEIDNLRINLAIEDGNLKVTLSRPEEWGSGDREICYAWLSLTFIRGKLEEDKLLLGDK